ncbi:hypothetical protein LXL04_006676 [Taraxacum kok-saghyz]
MLPSVLNSHHSSDSSQNSGKLLKKKVVAFPPKSSLFNGEESLDSDAAVFILATHEGRAVLTLSAVLRICRFQIDVKKY